MNDPAIDLAVISAILSSNIDTAIASHVCMAGGGALAHLTSFSYDIAIG